MKPGQAKRGRKTKIDGPNQLAMLLKFAKRGDKVKDLGSDWGLAQPHETLLHALTSVLLALRDKIRFPDAAEQKALRDEGRLFKGAIGAGDGTYTPTTRRKGQYSGHRSGFVRNMQAIVDAHNRVIFAAGGFGGSISDASQLDSTGILGEVVDGCFILCDGAYSTLEKVLAAGSDEAKEDPKEFTRSRSRVEHLFSRMKRHFRIIDRKWEAPSSYFTQAQLFVLCAILHNVLLDYGTLKDY
jgi:hypothetical protein